ncbi:hypothetical protein [Crassaminicella profunda]|uniref:hypothetical protein n=1 Tax=Crassaminicella profunda TaxID=1286698 RepID=UPI001CA799B7|nr:hypothetical protein [Crassaminicella profunda]QZY53679.1 hypothetical protein K7H06_11465 [Crassaminicella profunda]
MKELEIKKVKAGSAFKVTMYFAIIPVIIMIIVGIIALLIGAVSGSKEPMFFGIGYMIMSVLMIGIYGAFGALFAVLYNVLAGKFGGLEVVIDDQQEDLKEYM